jgi:hypothetical protein
MEEAEIIFMEPERAIRHVLKSGTSELATAALLSLATNSYAVRVWTEEELR